MTENKIIRSNDKLSFSDGIGGGHGLWTKTEIFGGYGIHRNPLTGLSELDECIFGPECNTVPVGGVQYAMEQIFGVRGPINIPTLYDDLKIGLPNATYTNVDVDDPDGKHTMPYKYGNNVLLFGVGLTGSAENSITKYKVGYRENSINMTKTAEDGTVLDGIMLPFRYTTQVLSDSDQKKYFGKKTTDEYVAYYLKRFEMDPIIKHLWDTGSSDDEIEITNSEIWDSSRTNPVQSITEMQLKITEKDIKEFFNITGRVDEPRFNTVALFNGVYNAAKGDYENVRMFSKLYIPTEPVALQKDLDIIYRVYGS